VEKEAAAERAVTSTSPVGSADVIDFTARHRALHAAVNCIEAFRRGEASFADMIRALIAPFEPWPAARGLGTTLLARSECPLVANSRQAFDHGVVEITGISANAGVRLNFAVQEAVPPMPDSFSVGLVATDGDLDTTHSPLFTATLNPTGIV
jgi:hypothetical protein